MATGPEGHLYVYYRVASDDAGARAAITALLAAVEAETGVAGRLLARCDDPATWMEIYKPVADADAFARQLDQLARRHGAPAITGDGRRHVECFAPLRPLPANAAGAGRVSDAR